MMFQTYEAFMVEIGVGGNILTQDFVQLGGLASQGIWFHNLWDFFHHPKLTIDIDVAFHIKHEWVGDATIIDRFIQLEIHVSS